jgi:hypothetical protein
MVAILLALVRQACSNVVVHFGHFLTLDPKCTGTFWASSTGRLTFGTKCTGTFWMVSMGLQLTCFTFDPNVLVHFGWSHLLTQNVLVHFGRSRRCSENVLVHFGRSHLLTQNVPVHFGRS